MAGTMNRLCGIFSSSVLLSAAFISFSCAALAQNNQQKAQRIVVAGGSITEIIYRLGQQDKIVGVDSTSTFPAKANDKPQIGYVRNLSAEGVLSLNPDLLLAEADAGPHKILNQLKQTKLAVTTLDQHDNLAGIEQKIITIAKIVDSEPQGQLLSQSLKIDRQALSHLLAQVKRQPRVLFVLSLRNGQPLVSGRGTSAHEVLLAAGAKNATGELTGWKPLSTEAALAINPDVIITMGRHGQDQLAKVEQLPHFKFSNAVKNKQIFTIDGTYLLGMGPRSPQAVVELATWLHPDAKLPENYQFRYARTSSGG